MFIVQHRKIFYIFSCVLIAVSVFSLAVWGLKPGIDFKGGSLFEVSYPDGRPEKAEIEKALRPLAASASVRPTRETGYLIRMRELTEVEQDSARAAVSFTGARKITEERFDVIGPLLGKEAMGKSFVAIGFVLLCIVVFITIAFRKVSDPVASWKYGLLVIAGLVHDVIISAGVFAFLGYFAGVEVDTLFVTALLVIMGYSVHDKVVVFDRVREHLRLNRELRERKPFEQVVGESISETMGRSINTSLTTLFALIALYFIGPAATQYFSFALIIGIIAGTYSSVCIGSPLLVTVEQWQKKV